MSVSLPVPKLVTVLVSHARIVERCGDRGNDSDACVINSDDAINVEYTKEA